MGEIKISVVVTTYNWPEALKLCLLAFDAQTFKAFEVIVADDGSADATREMLELIGSQLSYPLIHSWQEDQGFRAARSRNLAALKARGEYLIFIDGDCIPRTNFLERQMRLAESGCFLSGNRIKLPKALTDKILSNAMPIYRWGLLRLLALNFQGYRVRLLPLFYLPGQQWRKYRHGSYRGATSFSLSMWLSDFRRINGFEERYEGWGREDTDLVIRLMRAGVIRKEARFAAPLFHCWHEERSREYLNDNDQILEAVLNGDDIEAKQGLAQHHPG